MGYRDRMKKPEVPDVKFEAKADYMKVVGVMSAMEEDEEMEDGTKIRPGYGQASQDGEKDES